MPGTARDLNTPLPVGAELRRLRVRARLAANDVARDLRWSASKLSRIETSRSSISREDMERLLDIYDVMADERARLTGLANGRGRPARRPSYAFPDAYEKYSRLEERATRIIQYAALVIPGLLQTPQYASAVIQATPEPEDDLAKPRIEKRLVRQAVLGRLPPPELNMVIDEAVLMRTAGDATVMRAQMIRLQELSEAPGTTIRVLPFSIGLHPAVTGSFTLLYFDDDPPCAFCDGLTGGVLRHKADDVRRYEKCFEALSSLSLSAEESAARFSLIV